MHLWRCELVILATLFFLGGVPDRPSRAAEAPHVSIERHDEHLAIRIGEQPFAEYRWNDPQISRPYFCHVRSPSGVQVTRRHPPVEGEDPTDHDTLHPGIWFALGDLSGADSWRNKAAIRHIELIGDIQSGAGRGAFTVRQHYLDGDQPLAEEICRREIVVRPEGWLLVWESIFRPLGKEIVFGDQEEMGLGVRLATPLAVKQGGRILNSAGQMNEANAWGKQADWCEYSGTIGERRLGVLIVPGPENFRRCWFHARDYGFVAANPFGRAAFEGGEPSRVAVAAGESLTLRFAVLVFDEDPSAAFDRPRVYRETVALLKGGR